MLPYIPNTCRIIEVLQINFSIVHVARPVPNGDVAPLKSDDTRRPMSYIVFIPTINYIEVSAVHQFAVIIVARFDCFGCAGYADFATRLDT